MDLLEAVSQVIKDKGYINLNINNVCEYADVDRNAIYRHFGDFETLLTQFIESRDYWLNSLDEVKDIKIKDHKVFLKQMLISQYDTINSNVELQQLLIWELGEFSLRTKAIAERREILSEKLIKQFEEHFKRSKIDFNTITAIMIAGIYYLVLHKKHSTFCLVDFIKEKERVLRAIDQLVDILFEAKTKIDNTKEIAIRALNKGIKKEDVAEITGLEINEIEKLDSEI